jgi:hypothetical protein
MLTTDIMDITSIIRIMDHIIQEAIRMYGTLLFLQ